MEETLGGGAVSPPEEPAATATQEQPSPAHPAPPSQPSPPRPRRGGEGRLSGRRRLHDDRLFGDVLALKRWLARHDGRA